MVTEMDEPDRYDVFVQGTVFLDIVLTGLESAPTTGTEIFAEGMGSCPGGVANFAIAASRLGLRSGLAAVFGDDVYADFCWRTLADQEKVDLSHSRRIGHWHSPVTVSMSIDRDRAMVTHAHEAPGDPSKLVGPGLKTRSAIVPVAEELPSWTVGGSRVRRAAVRRRRLGPDRRPGPRRCSTYWTGSTPSPRTPARRWPTPAPILPRQRCTSWPSGSRSRS